MQVKRHLGHLRSPKTPKPGLKSPLNPSKKDYSQAWYEGNKADIEGWVSSQVSRLPLDLSPEQWSQMKEDICASIKSQWSSIIGHAALTEEPYATEDSVRVLLDEKHPLHQARGQDISQVAVNCGVKFITHADKFEEREDGSTATESVCLTREVPVKCSIALPLYNTFKSATEQALTEFFDSDWLSGLTDKVKDEMQATVRQAVQDYSAAELSKLENKFMKEKGLKDGDLAQVQAEFAIDIAASALVADYTVRRLWTSGGVSKWQPLDPMHVQIAQLDLPPSVSTSRADPGKYQRFINAGWEEQW